MFEEIDDGGDCDRVLVWATGLLVVKEGGEVGRCQWWKRRLSAADKRREEGGGSGGGVAVDDGKGWQLGRGLGG